jgi:glycosyltransferase involved in cell wall biosynthesis
LNKTSVRRAGDWSSGMKVSVVTPTHGRESHLPRLYSSFKEQTHQNVELLIYDDSDTPSPFIASLRDPSVKYIYSRSRVPLGAKRDRMVREAAGDVIAQFDDDDYYAPDYITTMVARLGTSDLVKLSGWYLFDSRNRTFYYWDTRHVLDAHNLVGPGEQSVIVKMPKASPERTEWLDRTLWGFGFSYVFKRRVYDHATFDVTMNEGQDFSFVADCRRHGFVLDAFPDEAGLALHIVHTGNTSRAFPNYRLPAFLVSRIFGRHVDRYWEPAASIGGARSVPATRRSTRRPGR